MRFVRGGRVPLEDLGGYGQAAPVQLTKAGRGVTALVQVECYGPRCVLLVAVGSMAEFETFIDRFADYCQPSSTMVLSSPVQWRPVTPPAKNWV